MTMSGMEREAHKIWKEYNENNKVYEKKFVEINECHGHGFFLGTGQYKEDWVCVKELTMEEWDAEKAARYNYLMEATESYREEKRREAKMKRYKKELEELAKRKAYIEKWLIENT